jgi:hypothetical protein
MRRTWSASKSSKGLKGRLFGAGAQAGVIRYITNKPKINVTEGSVTAGYGITAGGDPNSDLTAVLNLPLIADTLAIRGVIYNDRHGGYINNVPATFTRKATDLGIGYANYPTGCTPRFAGSGDVTCQVPPSAAAINNNAIAGRAINPVTYQGIRVSALWDINADWNALLTQSYQNMDAEGVFYQMPNGSDGERLPKQSVTLFNDSYNKDKFENTAFTVNGRIRSHQGGLHGLVSGAQYQFGAGLHELRARRLCGLLPVPRRRAHERPGRPPAFRRAPLGTRPSATRIRVTSCASAPRMTGACAASSVRSGSNCRSRIS